MNVALPNMLFAAMAGLQFFVDVDKVADRPLVGNPWVGEECFTTLHHQPPNGWFLKPKKIMDNNGIFPTNQLVQDFATIHRIFLLSLCSGWWFGTMEFYDFPNIGDSSAN